MEKEKIKELNNQIQSLRNQIKKIIKDSIILNIDTSSDMLVFFVDLNKSEEEALANFFIQDYNMPILIFPANANIKVIKNNITGIKGEKDARI